MSEENEYLHKNVENLCAHKRRLEDRISGLEAQVLNLEQRKEQYRLLYERAQRAAQCRSSGDQELSSLHEQLQAIMQLKDTLNEENVDLLQRLEAAEKRHGEESKHGACVICIDKLANIVCLPCKHLALCGMCDQRQTVLVCPICRADVHEKLPIFMP